MNKIVAHGAKLSLVAIIVFAILAAIKYLFFDSGYGAIGFPFRVFWHWKGDTPQQYFEPQNLAADIIIAIIIGFGIAFFKKKAAKK